MVLDALRAPIERLARIDRSSCSAGEHEAADWIGAYFREHGASVELERERVHGTYWWPLGITSAAGIAAAVAGMRRNRLTGTALGILGSLLVIDDLGAGARLLRRFLPKRTTTNVVARIGPQRAGLTLLIVAHHDAAHTGFFFNPRFTRLLGRPERRAARSTLGRRLARREGRRRRGLALMSPVAGGPALAAIGALTGSRATSLAGGAICAGVIGSFVDIALRPTVPGANDNLTGVSAVLAIAQSLEAQPLRSLNVMLLSTGAEESLMEGMRAFAERHFGSLGGRDLAVLCLDTLGSPRLVLAEAEGMLQVRRYDERLNELLARCAAESGVELERGITMRLGTDGYLALRHGIPAALLMSVDEDGVASNYHWPTDTPERVDYRTLADAVALCERFVRHLDRHAGSIFDAPALADDDRLRRAARVR